MADRPSRRQVIAAAAGALGAGTLGPAVVSGATAAPSTATVATRNCYLGADLFRLLAAARVGDETVRDAMGDLLATVDRSRVERRLDAIAAELALTEPDLVGVQEAALVRTGPPSDGTTPNATDVRYDFGETLRAALGERDLPYRVVATAETTDLQFPATVDGERLDVRLTDRDLILARDAVRTGDPLTEPFDAAFSVTRDDRTVTVERAYSTVEATVGDHRITFCNTHLESASTETRTDQAAELRAALDDRRDPVVLVGDFNSGPEVSTAGYTRLAESFEDVARDAGVTCCHAADLRNPESSLDARFDHVLVRGHLVATDVTRVGADPAGRIVVEGDRLWPSDHAGVVATLAPETDDSTPTTPTERPTTRSPTTSPTGSPTIGATGTDTGSWTEVPGFGAATAIVSIVAAAFAARRRSG